MMYINENIHSFIHYENRNYFTKFCLFKKFTNYIPYKVDKIPKPSFKRPTLHDKDVLVNSVEVSLGLVSSVFCAAISY